VIRFPNDLNIITLGKNTLHAFTYDRQLAY
jgi:hypothetical protein